ncbi:TcfC E-set like domain-containing protein [Microbulbifer halophilus]|uniref:TcfC E-set like domain-containing protein n=1 Tax=Microbulbifer halophilus TaxID=453963 RepID=A0ABW5E9M9_9GAMM|nr:TcfC E-set like domain-containing protein [Microbulbifer halophilus]MCW8124984.1 TcfC E-set like domain-containing protein [Microbulbifer halophilus]
MKRAIAGTLLSLAFCVPTSTAIAAASAAFTLDTAAPDGFADLTEAQELVVDIYYGSRQLGAARVIVDLHTLRFKNPAAVLALLPETVDPELLLRELSAPLRRNSRRVCHTTRQRDCGYLAPETVGLIYDERRFRADLFFAAELLPQQKAIEDPYLPESSSDFSFIQNLTGTWSGVDTSGGTDSRSASLYGHSILSFGESGLHSQWAASDEGDSQIYQMQWTRDFRGRAYSAGLLQPQGGLSSFAASPYLYGLEYRSSNNSRADNRYSQGAPLEVNMPVRGRVEIYRDKRLIHSELLEAGNQLLDTSGLPSGAYELDIRTYDESGRPLRQFRQLFAKDSLLPAPGEWRWAVQAGRPARVDETRLLPEQLDDEFAQAGISRRLLDNAGAFANVAATADERLYELGGRWVGEYLELSPSAIYTRSGRSGHRLYALMKTPLFNLSASETRLDRGRDTPTGDYTLLGRGYHYRNMTLNGGLLGGRLSLRYTEQDRDLYFGAPDFALDEAFASSNRLTTLEYRRDFFRGRRWNGHFTLAHSDADGEQLTTATFEFRYRGDHWYHSARLRGDSGREDGQDTRAGFNAGWHDGDRWAQEVNQQFSGEVSRDEYFVGSRTSVSGRRGHLSSTLEYRDNKLRGRDSLNYLGSFSTNFMSNGNASAWGGERTSNSAVMVDIDGSPEREFEVLVDGVRRGYARGGGRSVINLPAFQSYDVHLRPLAEGFYDYRERRDTVTLYPGNVTSAEYEIRPLILVLGRIVRGGDPVAGARISIGEYTAVADEHGVFQMEMYRDPRQLTAPAVRWNGCLVDIPEQESGKHWLNLGDIDLAEAKCERNGASYAAH